MKKLFSILVLVLLMVSCTPKQAKVSIFSDHIATIAQQEGLSFAEAAIKVYELGYTGVDVWTTLSDEQLRVLDSIGFEHACAIVCIDHTKGSQPKAEEQALAFMKETGWTRLLLVTGLLADDATDEDAAAAIGLVDAFSKEAAGQGFDVMVEDYDNPNSLSYNTAALDRLFAASSTLGHVFDTGNYVYCGEDALLALEHFRNRVHHVHLKDRREDGSCPAVGDGIVPMKEIITSLMKSGYDGWFTVEHFGSRAMLDDAARSIAAIRDASNTK